MASPQTGIFALDTDSHAYLALDLFADAQPSNAVALVVALRERRTTVGGVNLVSGFHPELWTVASPDAAPPGVVGFNKPLLRTMLESMPGADGGSPDKVLVVTRPLTGACCVIPSADALAAVGREFRADDDA